MRVPQEDLAGGRCIFVPLRLLGHAEECSRKAQAQGASPEKGRSAALVFVL